MDQRLVAWGRSVKSRARWRGTAVPPLWLFTDAQRMPDLAGIVRRLPKGLCGVVFRHDDVARRAHLAHELWRICRSRRIILVVTGRRIPGIHAGLHLRAARTPLNLRNIPITTCSAHGPPDLIRARRRHVAVAFLSPLFPTISHPAAPSLGVIRWTHVALKMRDPVVLALGGVDGTTVRRLPRWVRGVGAIGAFLDR